MNKEEVERIALEVCDPLDARKIGTYGVCEFAHRFLARIDAERGKEAVAWRFVDDEDVGYVSFQKSPPTKEQIEYLARWNLPKWEPLFLSAPTIPEGMALVPIEPTQKMIDAAISCGEFLGNEYRAMVKAAQGERK